MHGCIYHQSIYQSFPWAVMMVSLISQLYYLWRIQPVYLCSSAITLNKGWHSPSISLWLYGVLSHCGRESEPRKIICAQCHVHHCSHALCTVCTDRYWLTQCFLSMLTELFALFNHEQLVVGEHFSAQLHWTPPSVWCFARSTTYLNCHFWLFELNLWSWWPWKKTFSVMILQFMFELTGPTVNILHEGLPLFFVCLPFSHTESGWMHAN